MLYEFANALARRGHEVHFVHAPEWSGSVAKVEEIPFRFEAGVRHHLVAQSDDPSVPCVDVFFGGTGSQRGHPAVIVQGFRLLGPQWDAAVYRSPTPKVCVASWLVDVGRYYGVPHRQLTYVPVGLDHEVFAMRTPQTGRTLDVAMLFHPSPEKGWDVGRQVLFELKRRNPALRATVISLADPPIDPPPDGVPVVALGQRQLADDVYNQTKVFVQASHHEGLGLTAIEAMACGAALVTTDCGGSRDYAVPDETALVVPAGDVPALVERTESLLADAEHRSRLAANASGYVRKFDWAVSGRLLEDFLESYVADPASYQIPPGEDRSEDFVL